MGVRELTCCRRRGGRPLRLPVPWEPEVFLSILRERAGRLEMVSAAGRALDSAMCWDCGRRRKLRGRCWRGCPQFRRICRDIEVAVVAGRGAQRAGVRVAAVSEFAVVGVDLRLPQHYRNRLEKFDLIRGFATQSTSKGTRTKFRFCERGGGAA